MTRKINRHGILTLLTGLIIPMTLHAEDQWIGKWKSEPMHIDTETMTMHLEFNDSTNMAMGFETDNTIPNVGQCVSYISVSGTYDKTGPIFITHIDESTIKADIRKLKFDNALTKILTTERMEKLKKSLKAQLLKKAQSTFEGYDAGMMIYVSHRDDPNVMSFIFGDETNAMELGFTRVNQ